MPANLLDKIRAALERPASTTAQLAAALADARQADADARPAVERQAEAVAAGYLDTAEKRAKVRAILADLRADAEDAALILAETERQHAASVAADIDAARRAPRRLRCRQGHGRRCGGRSRQAVSPPRL